jgi:hypothetical protein
MELPDPLDFRDGEGVGPGPTDPQLGAAEETKKSRRQRIHVKQTKL